MFLFGEPPEELQHSRALLEILWSIDCFLCDVDDKFDKFWQVLTGLTSLFSLYPKGHIPMRKNTCRIILYTLWLKKKLHTCIIPCNTTLVRHVDNISTKYTHIIMHTFIILLLSIALRSWWNQHLYTFFHYTVYTCILHTL